MARITETGQKLAVVIVKARDINLIARAAKTLDVRDLRDLVRRGRGRGVIQPGLLTLGFTSHLLALHGRTKKPPAGGVR